MIYTITQMSNNLPIFSSKFTLSFLIPSINRSILAKIRRIIIGRLFRFYGSSFLTAATTQPFLQPSAAASFSVPSKPMMISYDRTTKNGGSEGGGGEGRGEPTNCAQHQTAINGYNNSEHPTSGVVEMGPKVGARNGSGELSPGDAAKCAAAYACGEAEVRSGMRLGIGSGTTMKFLIDWLREKYARKELADIRCVPTSLQTRKWLIEAGLPVCSLDQLSQLDLAIDGADEVDAKLNCIKGGGGCLLQEKIVQTCAKRFVVIGGLSKYSEALGQSYQSIPIEISPLGYAPIQRWITEKHGGDCVLRMFKCSPVLTENHNYLVDWKFPARVVQADWDHLNRSILCIPGVVETGLFIGVAEKAYFSTSDGQVRCILPKM